MKYIILFIALLFTTPVFAIYDKPYIEYDNIGISQINCIRCNIAIKRRVTEHKEESGKGMIEVYIYRSLGQIEEVEFQLSDNSYTKLYFCTDCKRVYQDTPEELDGISNQFRNGFKLEAEAYNIKPDKIKEIENRYKKIKVKLKGEQK